MKAIQIRNVPDDVHAVLQSRADDAGQSMQEYLLALLTRHTAKPTVTEWLAMCEANAVATGSSLDEVVEWIREERDSR